MTQQFLDEMEDKVDLCTSAPKTKDLIDELDAYMSVTNDQQSARLEQVGCVRCEECEEWSVTITILMMYMFTKFSISMDYIPFPKWGARLIAKFVKVLDSLLVLYGFLSLQYFLFCS